MNVTGTYTPAPNMSHIHNSRGSLSEYANELTRQAIAAKRDDLEATQRRPRLWQRPVEIVAAHMQLLERQQLTIPRR